MATATLVEALKLAIKRQLTEIHTCLPGKVESYNHEKQKASVKPLIKKKYNDGVVEPLPVIVDVPVIWPRSSNASLTFPVNKDDYILLLFSERSIERFLSLGGDQEPGDKRKFDLSDAIAIPGLYPFSEESLSENNEDLLLIYNDNKFRITEGGNTEFEVANDLNITVDNDGNINITGNANITIDGDANINVAGVTNLTSGGDVNITAPSVNITGNLTVSGETDLAGGGPGIARVGDAVEVEVTGGSSAGSYSGTITGGSGSSRSG